MAGAKKSAMALPMTTWRRKGTPSWQPARHSQNLRSGSEGEPAILARARSEHVLASGCERVFGLEHDVLLARGACPGAADLAQAP